MFTCSLMANIFKIQCIQHKCTHTHARTHAHTYTVEHQGNGTEEKAFKKKKVFKEDLKELTEVE